MHHPFRSILPGVVLTLMVAVSASSALGQTYEEWDQAIEDEFAAIAAERMALEAALADDDLIAVPAWVGGPIRVFTQAELEAVIGLARQLDRTADGPGWRRWLPRALAIVERVSLTESDLLLSTLFEVDGSGRAAVAEQVAGLAGTDRTFIEGRLQQLEDEKERLDRFRTQLERWRAAATEGSTASTDGSTSASSASDDGTTSTGNDSDTTTTGAPPSPTLIDVDDGTIGAAEESSSGSDDGSAASEGPFGSCVIKTGYFVDRDKLDETLVVAWRGPDFDPDDAEFDFASAVDGYRTRQDYLDKIRTDLPAGAKVEKDGVSFAEFCAWAAEKCPNTSPKQGGTPVCVDGAPNYE